MAIKTAVVNIVGHAEGANGLANPTIVASLDFSTFQGGFGATGTRCAASLEVRIAFLSSSTFTQTSEVWNVRLSRASGATPAIDNSYAVSPSSGSGSITFDISSNTFRVKITPGVASDDYRMCMAHIRGVIMDWDLA